MTFAVNYSDAPLSAVLAFRIVNSVVNFKEAVVAWNEMRITRKQLLNLSEDQLNDIGLTWSDLR